MAKNNKKIQKYITKSIKSVSPLTAFLVIFFILVGAVGGWFSYTQICKNDTFEVLGTKNITLAVNEEFSFVDEGVKIISLGRDISSKVKISTNIPIDSNGNYIVSTEDNAEYYLIYTIDDIKYNNIQRVRTIIVGEGL